MTQLELGAWLQQSPEAYTIYSPPPEAVGMTTRYELCFLESYARYVFSGAGRIVDLGCWYGATTAALARGLRANAHAKENRLVEAFDLFTWEKWMERHAHRLKHLHRSYEENDCFLPDVQELLRPYSGIVRLERRNLLEPRPVEQPIEFLFIDAQKSWSLGQSIASSFFPSLIPGTSYVVQQDFVWYHPTILSVHLLMWYLRDHFEFVHNVPRSCSSVFKYAKVVDLTNMAPPPPDYFTLEMINEAYEWSYGCAEPKRRHYLMAAKLFFLLERGYYGDALQHAEELFNADPKPPPELVAGMATVLESYRGRAGHETTPAGETAADEFLQAIASLMPGAFSPAHGT